MKKKFTQSELRNVVKGACFLGSGGGGGYALGMQFVDHFRVGGFYKQPTVDVVSLDKDELKENSWGVVVAYMGAPEKGKNLTVPDAIVAAVRKMEEIQNEKYKTNKKIEYILPIETGAASMIVACLTAAALEIPVLDVDGAGRAVPTLDLILYGTQGLSVNPTIITSEKVMLSTEDRVEENKHVVISISGDKLDTAASKIESLARPILSLPEYDQTGGLAMWFIDDVAKLDGKCVKDTITLCHDLGVEISKMEGKSEFEIAPIQALFEKSKQVVKSIIAKGTLESASTVSTGGFDCGQIQIGTHNGTLKMLFQNENLLLWNSKNPTPLIMAPDIIAMIIKPRDQIKAVHQWVYSNDDIMEKGALKEEFVDAEVEIIGVEAAKIIKTSILKPEYTDLLASPIKKQSNGTNVTMLDHYISLLNKLGYYGKYKSITED